ncbi:MAG: exopolysaccharide biosynthesis polyprenyl glycosylphosphotransferase, partial [Acidimicrobiaceae bacterium]|nr:exopolysaccharide biosynthesis polyprenyl glycosylphosphotransferase [Acidimicrobiaceae bacterium]
MLELTRPEVSRIDLAVPGSGLGTAKTTSGQLPALLLAFDLLGACLAWVAVLVFATHGSWPTKVTRGLPIAVALSALMLVLMAGQKLYLARACSIRAVEVAGVARSAALCALAAIGLHELEWGEWVVPSAIAAVLGGISAFVAVAYLRGAYMRRLRARGALSRPVCVLGVNYEAERLVRLFEDQPELGYRVVAALGEASTWSSRGLEVPAVDPGEDPAVMARALGATGIIVAVTAIDADQLDRTIRQLVASGLHVQISTGLTRVGHQRLRISPLGHQLLYYVEPPKYAPYRFVLKRTIDVVLTIPAFLLSAPVLLLAAAAIKLDDRGPVFYRQVRVGRHGKHFEVLKLRTMVPNASAKLAELIASNERNGPLFKLSDDPRVTRVGRVLRATSLDELPQLFNVLRGQMSLVGPRPALPTEVAQFDAELLERTLVPAGLTGLWQVEARDNPSFDAYRRLDLFYVDNW